MPAQKPDLLPVIDLLYWQAQDLAWQRRYDEAELILRNLEQADSFSRARGLDLLARINVRRKEFAAARAAWEKAVALVPDNADYQTALKHLPNVEAAMKRRPLRVIAWIAGTAAFVVVGFGIAWPYMKQLCLPSQESRPAVACGDTVPSSAMGKEYASAVEWPPLALNFATVLPAPAALTVVFTKKMFAVQDELSQEGKDFLKSFGTQFGPCVDRFSLVIEGHDWRPLPPGRASDDAYFDLGLRRALTVSRYLHMTAGLPKDCFVLTSAGTDRPPFQGETPAERAMNRTVVLKLIPKERIPEKPGP